MDSFLGIESLVSEIRPANIGIEGNVITWVDYAGGLPNGIYTYDI